MTENPELEDLLKSVLVPAFPPNRSQWKKLELAMKFINASKAQVERKRCEDHGGNGKSTQKDEDKVRKELNLPKCRKTFLLFSSSHPDPGQGRLINSF